VEAVMTLNKEGAEWIKRALERLSSLDLDNTDHKRVKNVLQRIQQDKLPILGEPQQRLNSARIIAEKMMNLHDSNSRNLGE
tara:strand:+ start:229 stop:471 length:243 start_codon:yes stop_codon:yes gene_type:complete